MTKRFFIISILIFIPISLFNGTGLYRFADGAIYEGGWINNKMHGDGKYIDCDGKTFSGKFFNGAFDSGANGYVSLRNGKN